jgi:diguanylate cyclase (GGDEF)-like protein
MSIMPKTLNKMEAKQAAPLAVIHNIPALTLQDKYDCLSQLQGRSELAEVLGVYCEIIEDLIRPFNVNFRSPEAFISVKPSDSYTHSDSFNLPLSSLSPRIGSITYQSNSPLEATERKLLLELHILILPSLKNALNFLKIQQLVNKDHLTKIGNRAYYDECLPRSMNQSIRSKQNVALLLFDIDNFKAINDTYGHQKGDDVLREFALLLKQTVRGSDIVFRTGGDEFAAILQPGSQASIDKVQARLLTAINQSELFCELAFTVSVGSSIFNGLDTARELFSKADKALYMSKDCKERTL